MSTLLSIVAGLAALVAAGVLYQQVSIARSRQRFVSPGEFVDVGGHRLHMVCQGEGRPVVVFESGIAASSLSWSLVQPAIAQFTRTCAYDRAGLAWSDAPSCPSTFSRIVDEFAAVVGQAASEQRCILVGHSFGSFIVRAYANRYPRHVAAVVLVDPPMEWLAVTAQRARMLARGRRLSRVGAWLAHLGIVRASLALLTGGAPAAPRRFSRVFGPTAALTLERLVGEVRKLPPALHPIVQAHWSQPKCFHAMAGYLRALADEGRTISALVPPRDVRVVVISAGHQPPDEVAAHKSLADAAERGRHVIAEQSGHWVPLDDPGLITGVISRLVDEERAANR